MKNITKIISWVGVVILALYLIGIVASAFVNILIGIGMILFGVCVIAGIYTIGAVGAKFVSTQHTTQQCSKDQAEKTQP